MKSLFSLLTFGGLVLSPLRAGAQTTVTALDWQYRLLEGSTLVDDCLICARPTILQPMRGTFRLVLIGDIPPFTRYELREISFQAGSSTNAPYTVLGSGTYQISGEVAVLQDMTLQVGLSDPNNVTTNKVFTNDTDTIPPAPAPKIISVIGPGPGGDISLNWTANGRVFQLEKATALTGPFAPINPFMVDLNWIDSGVVQSYSNGFDRLRQW